MVAGLLVAPACAVGDGLPHPFDSGPGGDDRPEPETGGLARTTTDGDESTGDGDPETSTADDGDSTGGASTGEDPPTDTDDATMGALPGDTEGMAGSTGLDEPGTTGGLEEETDGSGGQAETGAASLCDQPPGAMTPDDLPVGAVGEAYDVELSGPDGVYTYEWFTILGGEGLPDGIEFDVPEQPGTTARLVGNPTETGDFEFFVIANPTGEDCVNADALVVEFILTVDA